MQTTRIARRLSMLALTLVVMGAVLSGLPGSAPDVAVARKGFTNYKYKKYKPCKKACYTKQCRSTCKQANRTCVYCAKQDGRERINQCKSQSASADDLRACKSAAKQATREEAKSCRPLNGQCGSCCKSTYDAACNESFAGTSGFPTYFHSYKSYGRTRRYKPTCSGPEVGADDCPSQCERIAAGERKTCEIQGRRGGGAAECLAAVEAKRQACLAACSPSAPTTTTTTVPSASKTRGPS